MKRLKQILNFLFPLISKEERKEFGKASFKNKFWLWYAPQIVLWSLLPLALLYLFYPLLHPDITLFSNDGPLGVMNSRWMREGYPPGQPMWNDSWWLGAGAERSPIMITNTFYWVSQNPFLVLAILMSVTYYIYHALRNRYNQSLLPYEPEMCEDNSSQEYPAVSKSTVVLAHRFVFACMLARFTWIYFATLDVPWDITNVCHPLESLTLMGYLFLGLPFWISVEMEHRDYLRTLSERSPK
jgi:hypothetical protein